MTRSSPEAGTLRQAFAGATFVALLVYAPAVLAKKPGTQPLVPSASKPKSAIVLPPAPVARGHRGVVVSAHPGASKAGVEILNKGGNAMDAAVAVAFALSVVEPFSAGVGGGGFLLYYDARSQKVAVVDYREVAPKKAHRDMYLVDGKVDRRMSLDGIKAVAVPGMVPGLAEAQKKFGKKRLADVLDPAIQLAEKGFLVTPRFHVVSTFRQSVLAKNEAAAEVFLKAGQPYPVGERLIQKDKARTLREVKKRGARVFTHGRIAQAIAKESARLGGLIALEDLQNFKARFRKPLEGTYRGHTIFTMPPPSSGGTHLLQMLKMLEIDRAKRGRNEGSSKFHEMTEDRHHLIEVMRRAYADRATYMGDPGFVKVPIEGLVAEDYLSSRYAEIQRFGASKSSDVKEGKPTGAESSDTTHLIVVDAEGNVVSLTQTVNTLFGSCVVVPKTGVVLNNEMDDFSAAPGSPNAFGLIGGEANSISPGKIPLSSMTPTIVLKDGKVRLAAGSPGGSTIITTVLQIVLNVIDGGMDVAQAVAAPRMHMQWLPDKTRHEPGALSPTTQQALQNLGHTLEPRHAWGNATAIEILPDGTRVGAADPRGDGGGDAQ